MACDPWTYRIAAFAVGFILAWLVAPDRRQHGSR